MSLRHGTGVSKLLGDSHKYTPLHPEFVSSHTCTHIALWCGECNKNAYKAGMTHQDIFGRKERLSARTSEIRLCLKVVQPFTGRSSI